MIAPIDNFAGGIQASSGYTSHRNITASDIINFDVDEEGRLVKRRGSVHMNSVALPDAPESLFRAYYQTTGLASKQHLIAAVPDAQGLWYWNGAAFAELKNSSDSPASSVSMTSEARLGYAVFLARLFIGKGTADNQFWVDISGATPVLYDHGINDAPPGAPTCVSSATPGSLTAGQYYGYAVTFYRHSEDIESLPSARTTVQVGVGQSSVDLTNIDISADEQVTRRKIYRTDAQATAELAGTATLYAITVINDNTSDYSGSPLNDGSATFGDAIDCTDHDNPPQWHYPAAHNGRLWVSDDDDSFVYFCKIDDDAIPQPDSFPVAHVGADLLVYRFAVNQDDGDIITAIIPAPMGQQLLVFKRNSHFLVYGTDAATLDVSTNLKSCGCAAPWSCVQVGNGVYFLANDGKLWATSGVDPRPISLPVQPLLNDIPRSRYEQVSACAYHNKLLVTYPSGDNANDRILVFDTERSYWTTYDLAVNDLVWYNGVENTATDTDRLVAALSGSEYVDYLFTDASGDDLADDNGADITASWQSNWFLFPQPSTITGVKIYDTVGGTYTVRVDYVNQSGINTGVTHADFQPSEGNGYRQGVFQRGRAFRLFFSTTTPSAVIERIELEYEIR